MSFDSLPEKELRHAAEIMGVDLAEAVGARGKLNKELVAAAFANEGVTWDIYSAEKARLDGIEQARLDAERLEAERQALIVKSKEAREEEADLEPVEDAVIVTRKRVRRPNEVLVKMNRQNPHYEVHGKVFTRDHPFVLMTEDEAQAIFDSEQGFHIATPREAAEYYS